MAKRSGPPPTNVDYGELAEIKTRIYAEFDAMESSKSKHMLFCKDRRKDIKQHFADAKALGVDVAAFKLDSKLEELEAKVAEAKSEAESDVVVKAEEIRKLLGDYANTPLGGAAVNATPKAAAAGPKRSGTGKKQDKPAGDNVVDMSTRAKKDALKLAGAAGVSDAAPKDGEEDLRSDDQKRREAERQSQAAERLGGIKTYEAPPEDGSKPVTH